MADEQWEVDPDEWGRAYYHATEGTAQPRVCAKCGTFVTGIGSAVYYHCTCGTGWKWQDVPEMEATDGRD